MSQSPGSSHKQFEPIYEDPKLWEKIEAMIYAFFFGHDYMNYLADLLNYTSGNISLPLEHYHQAYASFPGIVLFNQHTAYFKQLLEVNANEEVIVAKLHEIKQELDKKKQEN